jgi:hypothetical protein
VTRLGLRPAEVAIVVPTDVASFERLSRAGVACIDPRDWLEALPGKISENYKGVSMHGGHADINNVLLVVANELVQLTPHNVLLQDVDVAWVRDPRPFLRAAAARRDVLGQHAPFWAAKGGVNTGFVFLRNSRMTRAFVQTLVNAAGLKSVSDQELFNIVLRHRFFRQVAMRLLPQELFYKYNGRRAPPPPRDTVLVYHSVGNHKRSSMEFHGFWFFAPGRCALYDAELDRESRERVAEGDTAPRRDDGAAD